MTLHKMFSDSALLRYRTNSIPDDTQQTSVSTDGYWIKKSEETWETLVRNMSSLQISPNDLSQDFSNSSLRERVTQEARNYSEVVRATGELSFEAFEALVLADPKKRVNPCLKSPERQWIEDKQPQLASKVLNAYNNSCTLLQINHFFLQKSGLSDRAALSIIDKSHEFVMAYFANTARRSNIHIHQGSFSKLDVRKFGNEKYVKKHQIPKLPSDANSVYQEARRALLVNSPFVEKPVAVDVKAAYYRFESNGDLHTVMYDRQELLTEENVQRIATGLADAIRATHAAGLIHRDIKPENILISRNIEARLTDFGFTKSPEEISELNFPLAGTLLYIAPELCEPPETRSYGKKVDVWAYGLILIELVLGFLPFPEKLVRIDDTVNKYMNKYAQQLRVPINHPIVLAAGRSLGIELNLKLLEWIQRRLCDPDFIEGWIRTDLYRENPFTMTNLQNRDPEEHLFRLALSCLQKNPSDRPSMQEVCQKLKDIPPVS